MTKTTPTFSRSSIIKGASLMVATLATLALSTSQAQAQSFDLGNGASGGMTMGANGPVGTLSLPADPGNNVQISGVAPAGGPASMGDGGTIGRTSFRTGFGNQGMGNIQDGMVTGQNNPMAGRGNNYGITGAGTGLMAPNSVESNAPMPVTASNSGHLDYGFGSGPQQYYDSIYGLRRAGNNLIDDLGRRLTGGFINSGRQALPSVSTGSVDFNTVTRYNTGFGP